MHEFPFIISQQTVLDTKVHELEIVHMCANIFSMTSRILVVNSSPKDFLFSTKLMYKILNINQIEILILNGANF